MARSVIIDQLSGREVVAGPEEIDATQPLIFYLTQRLGWNPRQIITRPQWRVPKRPSGARSAGYPVDVAIFDSPESCGDPDHVRIICECKAPDLETGIDELKTYLGLEPEARLGVWFNGQKHALVYKLAHGFQVDENSRIPRPADPLSPTAAQPPLRFADLTEPPNLGEVFSQLRDQIAAQDSHVNRDEFILNDLANLLICKIMDEQDGEVSPERPLAFQLGGSRDATAEKIRQYFSTVKGKLTSVFTDESDRLHIDEASLENVVRKLQHWRLLGHDRQAVGAAFQVLRGRALKGEEGAYFTPPPLVDCVVSVLSPDHSQKIIDPACGTGGFLAAALDHVFAAIDAKKGVREAAKQSRKRSWAGDQLFAVDKDAVSTKLCKAYLTLLGDGRSHVYRANSVDRREWEHRNDDLARVVADGQFDVVMTNPPFGKKLKVPEEIGRRENLLTCRRWKKRGDCWEPTDQVLEQQLGVAFYERAINLLKPGGRLAIVLPETFLFSPSFQWFVDWICRTVAITHIVDVPMVAFEEFCRAKTCLVFVRNEPPQPRHQIIMSFPKSLGQDRNGNALYLRNSQGEREPGDLDNEMADAVKHIESMEYSETRAYPRQGQRLTNHRYGFAISQESARNRGVLVPRFWWREETNAALQAWTRQHASELVTLGSLEERGVLTASEGHGSPPGHSRRTGGIPYVKVTDLKNWRVSENPTNFISQSLADGLRRRGPKLAYGDLVTPSRASSNIGQFSLILPWQTHVVLTKEVLVLKVVKNDENIDPFLLLALFSLKVVQDQYTNLALMQINRDHLGDHWREVLIPMPATLEARRTIAQPIRDYFQGIVQARLSYNELLKIFGPDSFGTRP